MLVMLLGAYNLSVSQAYSEEVKQEGNTVTTKQEEIKANQETLDKAFEFMNNKDYSSAIVYLTNYIQSKPKKYEAYKMRGECFYALRQYNLAQDDFQKAIDLKTSDDKFITGTKVLSAMVLGADKDDQYQNPELGNLYGMLMYSQKALNKPAYESSYQKAFDYNSHIYLPKPKKEDIAKINCPQKYGKALDPQGVDKYIYGAIEDIENGNYSESIYKSQYVTSNYPKYYLGYYLTGVSLVGLGKEKEAIAAFENALKYNSYDFESLASLGQIYFRTAEETFSSEARVKSVEYFKQALKYNPNCYLYYYYIGLNQLQLGDYDLAIKSFNSAIKYNSNDYNSMYYKLIAQYIQGDYPTVTSGATRLLYRHVSNYNSVLYLRALSQYKQGYFEDALVDIEKIHNNMNDIYNADVKKLSKKEKTLESYLYYLKAQIIQQKGLGVKADLQKAMQNPIIANLSKVDNISKQYTKALNDSEISLEDYNKYKSFYDTQLQGMLNSNLVITYEDIDNQYDYIRTTFDSLGVTFEYVKPNYKLSTIDNYAYKKYSSKLSDTVKSDEVSDKSENKNEKAELKRSTDPSETLAGENSSIAQMLASQSLAAIPVAGAFYNNDTVESTIIEPHKDVEKASDSSIEQASGISTEKLADNSSEKPILRPEDSEIITKSEEVQNDKVSPVENTEVQKDELNANKVEENAKLQDNEKDDKSESSESLKKDLTPTVITAPVEKESETFEIKNVPLEEQKVKEAENINKEEQVENSENLKEEAPVVDTQSTMEEENKTIQDDSENSEKSVNKEIDEISSSVDKEQEENNTIKDKASDKNVQEHKAEEVKPEEVKTSNDVVIDKNVSEQNVDIIQPKEDKVNNIEDEAIEKEQKLNEKEEVTTLEEKEVKQEPKVVEKQAKVNVENKPVNEDIKPEPKIKDGDEVVVFVPRTFMTKAEENLSRNSYTLKNPNRVTDDFAAIRNKAALVNNEEASISNIEKTKPEKVKNDSSNVKAKRLEEKSLKTKQKDKKQSKLQDENSNVLLEDVASNSLQKSEDVEVTNNNEDKVSEEKNVPIEPAIIDTDKIDVSTTPVLEDDEISKNKELKEVKKSSETVIGNILQSAFLGSDNVVESSDKEEENINSNDKEVLNNIADKENSKSEIQSVKKENKKVKKNKKEKQNIEITEPKVVEENKIEEVNSTEEKQSEIKDKNLFFGLFKKKDKKQKVNESSEIKDTSIVEPQQVSSDDTANTEVEVKNEDSKSEVEHNSNIELVKDNSNDDNVKQKEEIGKQKDDVSAEADVPVIRSDKAEVLEKEVSDSKPESKKEKKKFRWWWQKDKKDKNVKPTQDSETAKENEVIENSEVENAENENNVEVKNKEKDSGVLKLFKKDEQEKNKASENVVKEKKVIKELSK